MKTTSNAPKIQTLVVCKMTKTEHFILSIVHIYIFLGLTSNSIKVRKMQRAEETIQEDKL